MNVLVIDRSGFNITHREVTDEGFLRVPGRVARIGIQQYLASELGLKDRQPNDIINVYRPPEEVFDVKSLSSYDNKDVTDDHPSDMVNASTFKDVSVGHAISGGRPDGEFVIVDLLVKDAKAIDSIQSGKCELSAGYTAEYIEQKGKTNDGHEYEFIQRDIRINHIALVDRARAGNQARLFDRQHQQEKTMAKVTLDKRTEVEVADQATATLVQNTIDGLRLELEDHKSQLKAAKDEAEKVSAEKEKLDEDLEEEKKKSSDAALSERIATITKLRDTAKKIGGEKFSCDSLLPLEIKRAALVIARPNVAWADKSEVYVAAAFDMEAEKTEEERDEDKARESQDALGKDFEKRYTGDGGQAKGSAAYDSFLSGGNS